MSVFCRHWVYMLKLGEPRSHPEAVNQLGSSPCLYEPGWQQFLALSFVSCTPLSILLSALHGIALSSIALLSWLSSNRPISSACSCSSEMFWETVSVTLYSRSMVMHYKQIIDPAEAVIKHSVLWTLKKNRWHTAGHSAPKSMRQHHDI